MLYSIIRGLCRFIFFFLGLKTEGLHNLPASGPVIVAANHVSNWDPVVVAIALNRPVHFMGKSELFKYKILSKLFTKLNAFPVKTKTSDRKAIQKALRVLEEGNVLGIFPEGARNKTGDIKALPGVVMIALKSGAPIIPVVCQGTNHKLPQGWFSPLMVKVGEAVYLDELRDKKVSSAHMKKFSEDIMNKINSLLYK